MAYMSINKTDKDDYPFCGEFYNTTVDTTKDLDEQEETEVVQLRIRCDITEESHKEVNGFITNAFSVYVPFCQKCDNIVVCKGDLFRANVHGVLVKGKVEGVFPSEIGGFVCYVQSGEVKNNQV